MEARHKHAKFALPAILALAGAVWAGPVEAQVSVDTHALDSLPAAPAAKPAAPRRATTRARAQHTETARTESAARPDLPLPVPPLPPGGGATTAETGAPAPAKPDATAPGATGPGQTAAIPEIPAGPPPAAKIGPPETPPPLAALPPPPIPIAKDAPGEATPMPHGLRVTFGPDQADLNENTAAKLRDFAQTAKGDPNTPINVLAHAKGAPQDPSTPRRLALSRALAARAVLINEGIPSTRIYVRALGPVEIGDGPADRVDLILGRPAMAEAESAHPRETGSTVAPAQPGAQSTPAPAPTPSSPQEGTAK